MRLQHVVFCKNHIERVRTCMKSGTGILSVGLRGIGILPMIHGLEAHTTLNAVLIHVLRDLAALTGLRVVERIRRWRL